MMRAASVPQPSVLASFLLCWKGEQMNHDLHNPACTGKCVCIKLALGHCYRCGRPDALARMECTPPYLRRAAVSMVKRDGKYVTVWNARYNGWSFPGGLVEEGERCCDARDRELGEEVGLETVFARLIFVGSHGIKPATKEREGRGSILYLYEVEASGEPQAMEPGCPISLLTREEFLRHTPFIPLYEHVFGALDERARIIAELQRFNRRSDPGMLHQLIDHLENGLHLKEQFE